MKVWGRENSHCLREIVSWKYFSYSFYFKIKGDQQVTQDESQQHIGKKMFENILDLLNNLKPNKPKNFSRANAL